MFTRIQRPLRASAEAANRTIDDHLPRERLHHYGFEKNQLSLLAWQAYRNAQTEAIFTQQDRVTSQPCPSLPDVSNPAKAPSLPG